MPPTASIAAHADLLGPPIIPPIASEAAAPAETTGDTAECPGCGGPIPERFCGRCGEARAEPGALRLRHLAGELFEHLTSLDFRIVQTLWALVRRPGSLTRDFVLGRRNGRTRPLALYLLVSGAFFLLSPHLPGKPVDPRVFIDNPTPIPLVARHHDAVARRHGETRAAMAQRVARSSFVGSRYSAALLVPALAAVLALLLAGRRRLLAEHALFAIHAQCFLLMLAAGTLGSVHGFGWIAGHVGRAVGIHQASDLFVSLAAGSVLLGSTALLVGHLRAALRRVYGLTRWAAAWRVAVLVLAIPFAWYLAQFALVEIVALTGVR
jgi:hypothetical protein